MSPKPVASRIAGETSGVLLVGMGVTVMVPENVSVTDPDPPGENAASTSWKGSSGNGALKIPTQSLLPSLVTPVKTNCAVD